MKKVSFSEIFSFQKKSKIKAGDGKKAGEFPFYTSSNQLTKRIDFFIFEKPSLIFGTGGQASIHYCSERFSVSTDCFVTQSKNGETVDLKYVFYYLSGHIRILEEGFKGAGLKHISKEYISKIRIPLPPLETQKKIAAILDKADELRRNDQKILEKYDQLAHSVFLEMFGDPVTNPKGWKISNLKASSIIFRDGPFGSNLKSEHYVNQGVRIIRLQNIGINTFINNDKAYISEEHYETIKKHTCKRGDVIVATLGDPNVRACKFPIFLDKAINKADCVQIRPKTEVLNDDYLIYLLNSPAILYWVAGMLHGQTRTRVSMGQLSTINIPIPPSTLQNNFAEIIKHIETQKQLIQQSLQKSEELFQSLLQKAFKGELR